MSIYDRTGAVAELRQQFLQTTVEHAWQYSPFYRDLWGEVYPEVQTTEDLQGLPIIKKDTLQQNLDNMVTTKQMPDFIQFTGGTLSAPALRFRNFRECQTRSERNKILNQLSGKERKLYLHMINPMNGPELSVPGWPSIVVPLVLEKHFAQVDRLLRKEFEFEDHESRVSTIISGLDRLKMLTAFFLEQDTDFSQYNVTTIMSSAAYLTRRWRRIFEESWNARVVHYYGLSEVSEGRGIPCNHCGAYHCQPIAVPEVISLQDGKPVEQGIGVLVLTTLYPFVQLQPMIRYWTDDVVEIGSQCEQVNDLGFIFKGRRLQSIIEEIDGTTYFLLFPTDIVDILDELPEIAIEPESLIQGLKSQDVGYHKWSAGSRITKGLIELDLHIELKYSPFLYPDRSDYLRAYITRKLKERNKDFKNLMDSDRLKFSVLFHPPDSLNKVIV